METDSSTRRKLIAPASPVRIRRLYKIARVLARSCAKKKRRRKEGEEEEEEEEEGEERRETELEHILPCRP
jgi:hypothetical protein